MKEREYLILKIDELLKGCPTDVLLAIYRAVRDILKERGANHGRIKK